MGGLARVGTCGVSGTTSVTEGVETSVIRGRVSLCLELRTLFSRSNKMTSPVSLGV